MTTPRPTTARVLPLSPRIRAGAALLVLLAGGCGNPLATTDDDRGPLVPLDRLRTVKPMVLAEQTPAPEQLKAEAGPRSDPFFGLERRSVTLEEVRRWTLENNLDLQVALVDPLLAQESQNVEEAKFEWLLFSNVRYADFDQPTASRLSGSQVQALDIDTGVQIPLRTGGTVTVNVPMARTEDNNEFSTLNPAYESDVGVSISQPLLRGGGRRATMYSIRIAALDNQIVQARTNLEVIRQLAESDRVYWRLYAANKLLEVRQKQYELAAAQLERAKRRAAAGVVADVEVIRAESGLAERLEGIITAEVDVRRVQRELKRIINTPGLRVGDTMVIDPGTPPDPVRYALDPRPLADGAVANRMEMLELELRLAQDMSTIDFEQNQALPLFTLDYRYNINGLGRDWGRSFEQVRDNNYEDWIVSANLEIPLGNEAAKSRVNRAILQRLQRLSSREARELAIRQEVFDATDALNSGWQRIMAARQAAITAARTLTAEERQFEVGNRTSTDVLNAAAALAEAQSAEIRALADYQIAQIDLAFATGTLLGAAKVEWSPAARDPQTALPPPEPFPEAAPAPDAPQTPAEPVPQ